jgi:hypothetical protein
VLAFVTCGRVVADLARDQSQLIQRFGLGGTLANTHAGGAFFYSTVGINSPSTHTVAEVHNTAWGNLVGILDLAFSATLGQGTPVATPEPATLTLTGLGLVVVARRYRRRRAQTAS